MVSTTQQRSGSGVLQGKQEYKSNTCDLLTQENKQQLLFVNSLFCVCVTCHSSEEGTLQLHIQFCKKKNPLFLNITSYRNELFVYKYVFFFFLLFPQGLKKKKNRDGQWRLISKMCTNIPLS